MDRLANKFSEMIDTDGLVLVDFYNDWCGPCKMMAPIVDEVSASFGDKTRIVKVDVDKDMSAASRFSVTHVPTLLLLKDGRVVWRQSGIVPFSTVKEIVESFSDN